MLGPRWRQHPHSPPSLTARNPRPAPPPRLGERLDEHAQFGKQRALQLLRARLLETPVKSSQVGA